MKACTLHLVSRFAYVPTLSGHMAPKLDVALFAPPMPRILETSFIVDTGCEVPLVIARALRDALVAARIAPRRASFNWGGPVECEVFKVFAHAGSRWRQVEAYFPLEPESEENLAGLPLLDDLSVCLRAPQAELYLASA